MQARKEESVKIHEFQAKDLMRAHGVPVPAGAVADTVERSVAIAGELGPGSFVVKAQIHAGGRGKGGGVKLAADVEEVRQAARAILGMTLVTPQTGPQGRVVRKILVERAVPIAKEFYAAFILDRKKALPVLIASAAGGMEIEVVSARQPELIISEHADPVAGFPMYKARGVAFRLGLEGTSALRAAKLLVNLYRLFVAMDCSLAEINPLVLTADGHVVALDAKINFDDSALGIHPELATLRDFDEEEPLEVRASQFDLNYIKLDGTIGCMVNGAGLAMATMDIIKLYDGEPANFLDVGGGASEERVTEAFKILLADGSVKAVLINIFGGIVRCDRVANGIVAAARKLDISVPMVVRLKGTNSAEGRVILEESGLQFQVAEHMDEAARKVVTATGRRVG
ncbi:ADP-forming succinate--CoA ligase subunit beta [bacterium]|nr:ADP-forming succinate--CoA ligase subunit beta [candidate division CSSED10-310 bacterium]